MRISIKAIIAFLFVALAVSACGLISGNPVAQPTPNLTLTALFDTSVNIPATVTPIYVIVTNTPEPVVATSTVAVIDTVAPTNTTGPAVTATNTSAPVTPVTRVPYMTAGYINFDPTIDGSWSEWKDYTTLYPAASVVYGRGNWTGSSDLEASYGAAWDYDYLYIGVKVFDDVYAQGATGQELFKGDSIEILLDTNLSGDFYVQSLSTDDYQLGISAGDDGNSPEAYLWYPSSKAGSRTSSVAVGYTTEEGLYRIEARIPWSVFNVTPYSGMHLGIAVSVSDNDNESSDIQQTMVSSSSTRALTDPTTWGEIVLK
jgi:hypothetical protein